MRFNAGEELAGAVAGGRGSCDICAGAVVGLNFTAGTALPVEVRLVGVAVTTVGGCGSTIGALEAGFVLRGFAVAGVASTIRIGNSPEGPVAEVVERGVAAIWLRIEPPATMPLVDVPSVAWDRSTAGAAVAVGAPGGGTVAGPIMAYGFCQAGFWHPAASAASDSP